jgi:hypothetical protein
MSARVNRTEVGAIAHAERLPQQTAIRKDVSQIHGLVRLMGLRSKWSMHGDPGTQGAARSQRRIS